jgi:shikimate kinase
MPVDKRNIVLVGMPAAGKSTLGVLLAKQLRYNFVDTDISIQVENDGTLAELIERFGNDALLAMESRVCSAIEPARTVVATGGSAVYSHDAMEHLRQTGPVVYLLASYDEVAARVGDVVARGVVLPAGYTFRQLYDERHELYLRYADVVVGTTGLGVQGALDEVAAQVTLWMAAHEA